jgi:tRNA threonylcarbamoyladenosine biosynthesis protein TsaB
VVHVLALDTATPAVTAGVVELTANGVVQRSVRVAHDARKHAELLMPGVVAACDETGLALTDLAAVVTGVGPGPFTGLRAGMVTAAALGDALGIPVHGVCSLDAIAHGLGAVVVVTDARRREVYWAAYTADGRRAHGPHVNAPAVLRERIPELGVRAAAGGSAEVAGLPVVGPAAPTPAGLVAVAAPALREGVVPGPLEPLYLRRPDAVEPGARKRVTGISSPTNSAAPVPAAALVEEHSV